MQTSVTQSDLLALHANADPFQLLVENSLDILSEVTAAGEFLYVSPSAFRVLGFAPEELIGKSIFSMIHPEDLPLAQKNFGLPEGSATCRCRHKDGSWRWLETSGRDFFTQKGEMRGVLVSRDVTERIKSEEERGHLETQLRQAQKQEVIGSLASGIAHDFNNILTVLLAHTELARLDANHPERVNQALDEIRSACERARNLTQRILSFSRKQTPERKPVRLQSVIQEVFGLLRSTLPASMETDLYLDTTTPAILADSTQIHQILLNLCANAKHAMRGGYGRLMIRLDTYAFDSSQGQATPDLKPGLYARLSVTDTGHGMSEAVLKRIFEPFFTTKPPGEGTGLGLPIVQSIVKEHGGDITVRSRPNQGTTFEIYFPAHFPAAN